MLYTLAMLLLQFVRSNRAFNAATRYGGVNFCRAHATGLHLKVSMSSLAPAASAPTVERVKAKKVIGSRDSMIGKEIKMQGWVRTVRDQKKFAFINLNDGSNLSGIQVVAPGEIETYAEISKLTTGAAIEIIGTVVESQGKGQTVEIKASEIKVVGACPADTYPLQKKRHSQEFLRGIAHLRARTNTISAVSRVRSALAASTHEVSNLCPVYGSSSRHRTTFPSLRKE